MYMQKIATQVFIGASVVFGLIGITMALTGMEPDSTASGFEKLLGKLFMATVFVILSSFALSVAGKYLKEKK
jgi:hypothetical protein